MRWYFVANTDSLLAGTGVYCSMTLTGLLVSPLVGSGIYCSRTLEGLITSPLSATGVYCSQDLSLFPRP